MRLKEGEIRCLCHRPGCFLKRIDSVGLLWPVRSVDVLTFGGDDGNVHAYGTSGQKLYSFGALGRVASGPTIFHDRVYWGSFDHFTYYLSIKGQWQAKA
jgi:outer membrane protein assembly factor BamB